jgi:hypothetical protein
MGLRFRKSVKLLPGVRMNFGSKGIGWTLGPRGASIGISQQGVFSNVGIPGTGLSFRQRIGGPSDSPSQLEHAQFRAARLQAKAEKELARLQAIARRADELANCKLSLKEDGTIKVIAANDSPLSRKEIALMWEQQGPSVMAWLKEQAEKINSETTAIVDIHLETPSPDLHPEYDGAPFDDPKPMEPARPAIPPVPDKRPPEPIGFFDRLLPWRKRAIERRNHENEGVFSKAMAQRRLEIEQDERNRSEALDAWKQELQDYEARRQAHLEEQSGLSEEWRRRLRYDQDFVLEILSRAIDGISWPRETIVSFEIRDEGKLVVLDVDLPEVESMPTNLADPDPTKKGISIRKKPLKQIKSEYVRHIHGVCLLLLGSIFSAAPAAETVIVSGYSQRVDKATGFSNEDYLISVKATREKFADINFSNLENVDPVEALGGFDVRRKIGAGNDIRTIEPIA